jgi:hypothetical protein
MRELSVAEQRYQAVLAVISDAEAVAAPEIPEASVIQAGRSAAGEGAEYRSHAEAV